MKRVIAILLAVMVLLFVFVACGDDTTESSTPTSQTPNTENSGNNNQDNNGENTHTHTYKIGTEWMSDATGHWYEVTCECEDAEIVLDHTDANNDGNCDICGYTEHEHEYSEEWTADCTNHWNAADCGHIVAGINLAAHADENNDGECDTCKYVIQDLHTHYYSSEWTTDEQYHWHAPLCEHKAEVADRAAHVINDAGKCVECGVIVNAVDVADMLAVLKAAVANNYLVTTGNVKASQTVYDSAVGATTVVIGSKLTNEVYFVLGNNDSYIFWTSFDKNDTYTGGIHQFYEKLEDGTVFGAQMLEGDHILTPCDGDAQFLSGYNYMPGSILAAGYEDTSTLAITLFNLYDIMVKGDHVTNAVSSYDAETGIYSFAYTYYFVNATEERSEEGGESTWNYQVEYYNVAVEFRIDDNFVINIADFTVEVFRNYEADMDLDYDPETDTVTLRDDASVSVYAFSVSQTSGERTYTTIYPRKALVPIDFDLYYVTEYENLGNLEIFAEELIEETLTVDPGKRIFLHLGALVPSSASSSFMDDEDFEVTYINKDGSAACLWNPNGFYTAPSYSKYSSSIAFNTYESGTYEVTIRFGKVSKTINIVVVEKEIIVPPSTEESVYVKTTDTYNYAQDSFTYTSTVAGTYKFTIPANVGILLEGADIPDIDIYDNENGTVLTYEFAENETKTFYIAAEKKALWTINVELPEVEPTIPEGLTENPINFEKSNQVGPQSAAFAFTAVYNGNLTIEFGAYISKEVVYFVSVNDGEAVQHAASTTTNVTVVAGDKVKIVAVTNGGYSSFKASFVADLTDVEPDGSFVNPYAVEAENSIEYPGNWKYVYYKYTAEADGKLVINVADFNADIDWGYGKEEYGTKRVTEASAEITLAKDEEIYIVVATMSNAKSTISFTATFTEATEEEGDEEGGGAIVGVVTYEGANGSGRGMRVIIDAEAGTMTLIRAALAGNSFDTSTGASAAEYTYSFDGTTVTYACVTGQNCTCTFDENGAPVSIIWGSAPYTGFTIVAE